MDWITKIEPEVLIFGFGGWVLLSLVLVVGFITIVKRVLSLMTNHMSEMNKTLVALRESIIENTNITSSSFRASEKILKAIRKLTNDGRRKK